MVRVRWVQKHFNALEKKKKRNPPHVDELFFLLSVLVDVERCGEIVTLSTSGCLKFRQRISRRMSEMAKIFFFFSPQSPTA